MEESDDLLWTVGDIIDEKDQPAHVGERMTVYSFYDLIQPLLCKVTRSKQISKLMDHNYRLLLITMELKNTVYGEDKEMDYDERHCYEGSEICPVCKPKNLKEEEKSIYMSGCGYALNVEKKEQS